jgi:ammonia channel protein AmtB
LFYGNPGQLWIQIVSIVGTAVFSAIGTLIVIYITKLITGGLRVTKKMRLPDLTALFTGKELSKFNNHHHWSGKKTHAFLCKRRLYHEKN